jgi:mannose-6-phosphate isomerase-like protein (cupin superfamily)
MERHPTMHRTDALDCFVVMRGEVYLVSDTDEVLLRAGDTAVVQGVNHAWSNRSNEPVLIAGVMTHANPLPTERYPAPGL